jgi:hypothetical protein
MAFGLMGLALGGFAGFLVGRLWSAVVVILLPFPWLLGIAIGLWGNGFGENWGYLIPLWIGPACLGFVVGVLARRATSARARGGT